MKRLPFAPRRTPYPMSIWTNEDIIDVSFLPVYVFLLLLNMYNLWEFHWRREYVLLLISSGCITPRVSTNSSRDSRNCPPPNLVGEPYRSLFCPMGNCNLKFGILPAPSGMCCLFGEMVRHLSFVLKLGGNNGKELNLDCSASNLYTNPCWQF